MEMSAVNNIIKTNPNFSAFLSNPTIGRSDKVNKVFIINTYNNYFLKQYIN